MLTPSASRRTTGLEVGELSRAEDLPCLHIPRSATTFEGFREWIKSDEVPEKLRVSFFDEEIYLDMSKEELESHAAVKAEISRVLMNLIRALTLGKYYLDGVLFSNRTARISTNPDAIFISWDSLEKGQIHMVPGKGPHGQFMEIEGIPDWILDVVSNSSVLKDTDRLRLAYHRAGISEYWLVDARGPEILFQILHWRKTGYISAPSRGGWQRSRVFGRNFRLVRKAMRLGLWQYTLRTRPK